MWRQQIANDGNEFAAWIGLDWGDQGHAWMLQWIDTAQREQGRLDQTPEAFEAWIVQLRSRLNGRRIGIAIEQKHGAVVWMLLKYAGVVIYPIHPRAAGQFRQALYPSGGKSDPTDAELLLELLVHHRDHFRPLEPEDEPTRRLLLLVEQRRHWVDERKRHGNRLTARLKVYFPQVLRWFGDVGAAPVLGLLSRWLSLEQLQRAQRKTLETFIRGYRRSDQEAAVWAEAVRTAVPAIQDAALMESHTFEVTALALLTQIDSSIAKLDQAINKTSHQHANWEIAASLPGAGPVMAPRLLAAMGSNRNRYENASQVQCASGIAPVIVASGRSKSVQCRKACPKFLRQTFHEWAQHSMKSCGWARAYYDQLRARGQEHHAAVRSLAFKWQRILFRCWKDGVPYDESKYLAALRKRNSPLLAWLA